MSLVGIGNGLNPFVNPLSNPHGSASASRTDVVKAAAKKYGIPEWVLIGVWGVESDFGQNSNTSSAGAKGDFQFIPGTAATYHYPLVNNPNDQQFSQQADSAAHYLSDLIHQTGSVDSALQHYSGGGYGESQVQAKAKSFDPHGLGVDNATSKAAGAASDAIDAVSAPLKFFDFLTNIQTWIRLGEGIAGLVLIFFGLRTLTGGN